ncbi:MAG: hypothetical protein ACRD3B_10240, partial [Candidatus Sulfotelmatobacter sp.]
MSSWVAASFLLSAIMPTDSWKSGPSRAALAGADMDALQGPWSFFFAGKTLRGLKPRIKSGSLFAALKRRSST